VNEKRQLSDASVRINQMLEYSYKDLKASIIITNSPEANGKPES
jgi:hypothetical protein